MSTPAGIPTTTRTFFLGVRSAIASVFFVVLAGTYIGIGALAHDYGFSPWWLALSTLLVWAAPAQVILISLLGTGGLVEIAIAVSLSSIRMFPMTVALLPLLRGEGTRNRDLLLPAHFTSVSMWVESLRLLPALPVERRIAFCNGLSAGYMGTAMVFGFVGFFLAAGLPALLAGGLPFLTPISFLISTARNSRAMIDRIAFVLGLVIGPVLAAYHVGLDLLWTGIGGGVLAYAAHRLRTVLA